MIFPTYFWGLVGFIWKKLFSLVLVRIWSNRAFFLSWYRECFGPDSINSVISGSHYARACSTHSIIHEVIMSMMFEEFLRKYPDRSAKLQEILVDFNSNEPSRDAWNALKQRCEATELAFQAFLTEMSSTSQSFAFWNTCVSEPYPIARDLTNSLCCGDWILYLSAVERATSLFFFLWLNELQ